MTTPLNPTERKRDARRKAGEMREQGMTYQAIADALGVDNSTVWKWLHPERTQALNEADRTRRRDRRRATDRLRARANRAICAECGQPGGIGSGLNERTLCGGCVQARADARRDLIKRMWADGRSLREIAEALNTTVESLGVAFVRIRRAEGVEALPYRYRLSNPKASRVA